ncbi:MAG: hypothetical protein VKN60_05055 [Cyanobacteriota bacterium]|nr:hypothetical protein [Cyanobacteriota bacterium]
MTLQAQAQRLIENTPPQILDPQIMAQTVVPLLLTQAEKLACAQAYLWVGAGGESVILTLQHRQDPTQIRKALYGFADSMDARRHPEFDPKSMTAAATPILDLLFRVLTDPDIDLLCFFPAGEKGQNVIAFERRDLQSQLKLRALANRSLIA